MNLGILKYRCITKCLSCFKNSKIVTVVPNRTRYNWEARPESRERIRLMQITLPRLTAPKPMDGILPEIAEEPKLYGLDNVYHNEIIEIFKSRMMMICLLADSDWDDYYRVRYELQEHGLGMEIYPQHVLEFAFERSPYHLMSRLCFKETIIIYGDLKADEVVKALKQNKHILLLGGVMDNEYVSAQQFRLYSQLPSLEDSRGQLCSTMTTLQQNLSDILTKGASNLSSNIDQYITQKSETES